MKTFTLKLKSEAVEIDGTKYTINELTGAGRDAYMQDMSGRMKTGADGKAVITNYAGLQSTLVGLALRTADGKAVDGATLATWPASTIDGLFQLAQSVSALGGDASAERDAAKNG